MWFRKRKKELLRVEKEVDLVKERVDRLEGRGAAGRGEWGDPHTSRRGVLFGAFGAVGAVATVIASAIMYEERVWGRRPPSFEITPEVYVMRGRGGLPDGLNVVVRNSGSRKAVFVEARAVVEASATLSVCMTGGDAIYPEDCYSMSFPPNAEVGYESKVDLRYGVSADGVGSFNIPFKLDGESGNGGHALEIYLYRLSVSLVQDDGEVVEVGDVVATLPNQPPLSMYVLPDYVIPGRGASKVSLKDYVSGWAGGNEGTVLRTLECFRGNREKFKGVVTGGLIMSKEMEEVYKGLLSGTYDFSARTGVEGGGSRIFECPSP